MFTKRAAVSNMDPFSEAVLYFLVTCIWINSRSQEGSIVLLR